MEEAHGPDRSVWPHLDAALYFATFGGPKRGRYYGLGSGGIGALIASRSRSSPASGVTPPPQPDPPTADRPADPYTPSQMADPADAVPGDVLRGPVQFALFVLKVWLVLVFRGVAGVDHTRKGAWEVLGEDRQGEAALRLAHALHRVLHD